MSYSSKPNEIEEDRRLLSAYILARRSWIWPLVAGFASSLIGEFIDLAVFGRTLHFAWLVLGTIGLAAALYALATVPRNGRRSIITSALAGVILNSLLIIGGVLWLAGRSE